MNILLLSSGGGGGNILRSLKTLFARDVAVAQKTDAKYADRLRRAITARFLDTNEFSLAQVPKEERVLIGAETTRRVGSRHSPELAARALEESRHEVERLIAKYSVVVLIGTGGKGTGAGTMFPLAEIARRQNKLVLPVFVRPSFERHEVDKRRYDHALHVAAQFDHAGIRLIEILNDRAYSDRDPQPQSVVWERMNLPIARGLRGLLYVLWDLSQVDPSDLSILLAGHGRIRMGFAEIDPAGGSEPSDAEIAEAVRACWHNAFCAFREPTGTSLVCIQGDWSNLADAKIKGGIAALALGDTPTRPYNPLYARAFQTPKPWGITALFAEYTGVHEPLALDWSLKTLPVTATPPAPDPTPIDEAPSIDEPAPTAADNADVVEHTTVAAEAVDEVVATDEEAFVDLPLATFDTVVDLAKALNRSDPAAVELAGGEPQPGMTIDGAAVRKLLGTLWFPSVFPKFSVMWRDRLLAALGDNVVVQNHAVRVGRQTVRLKELSHEQLKEVSAHTMVWGDAGADLHLLLAVGNLWGEQAVEQLRFADTSDREDASRFTSLLGLRR